VWSAKTDAMTTFTSSSASLGVEGIVNLLLRDRASGGGHEWQAATVVLGTTDFCTLDTRQGKMAQLAGLRV
jgi:hypothetical protein